MKPALLLLAFSVCFANAAQKPNIVFILADDLGWADTTLYGHTTYYHTPNLERLAKRGIFRVYVPAQKQPVEIDWIKLNTAGKTKRWDF